MDVVCKQCDDSPRLMQILDLGMDIDVRDLKRVPVIEQDARGRGFVR
jgi:hypothetical protein